MKNKRIGKKVWVDDARRNVPEYIEQVKITKSLQAAQGGAPFESKAGPSK